MSVFNVLGSPTDVAYAVSGNTLSQAYDIDRNPLLGTRLPLNVMTYNVQWFTRINSQTAMQRSIIDRYTPSIIGMQEFSLDGNIPAIGQEVLSDYSTIVLSNHVNYLGIASKLPLTGTTSTDFVNQDPEDMSRYGETRAYMKTYFTFNGKRICFINTHLAVITASYIYAQMAELFALAEQEDYVIITADFNTNFSSFDGATYRNTFKQFVDAGYNLVNNSPAVGITKTYSSSATASSLSELMSNPDSIIVSSNIDIESRDFDTTKFNYLDGNPIDHIAVAATLLI